MVKEEKVEKIIKQAIENCDHSMKEVRSLLSRALKEIQKSKKKNSQKSKNIFPNWKLNTKIGVLEDLNLTQKRNVLNHIEKMISDENYKIEPKNNDLISE